MAKFKTGLKPFDPQKHERFNTPLHYGFSFPAFTYPIERTGALTNLGMDGNGPDDSVTLVSADPNVDLKQGSGDCAVADNPAHISMIAAALADVHEAPLTSDQTLTIYYLYMAHIAGITWQPETPVPAGIDQGCDMGDLLLWLFTNRTMLEGMGLRGVEAFLRLQLSDVDAALSLFGTVTAGWVLPADINTFEQQITSGQVATCAQVGQDGHCMGISAVESPGGITVVRTWGQFGRVDANFRQQCLQQAFAVLTKEQAESVEFPFEALVTDLKELGGTA